MANTQLSDLERVLCYCFAVERSTEVDAVAAGVAGDALNDSNAIDEALAVNVFETKATISSSFCWMSQAKVFGKRHLKVSPK